MADALLPRDAWGHVAQFLAKPSALGCLSRSLARIVFATVRPALRFPSGTGWSTRRFLDRKRLDLPPTTFRRCTVELTIQKIVENGEFSFNDDDVRYLCAHRGVKVAHLNLGARCAPHCGEFTLVGFRLLAPTLTSLYVSSTNINDAYLQLVPALVCLAVATTTITDVGLRHLKGRLTSLPLKDEVAITDAGLLHVADTLRVLRLDRSTSTITSTGLSQLSQLEQLEVADTWQTTTPTISDKVVRSMPRLTSLAVDNDLFFTERVFAITRKGFPMIAKSLARLRMPRSASIDKLFRLCTNLTALSLFTANSRRGIRSAGLDRLPCLTELGLQGGSLRHEDVPHFPQKLKTLRLDRVVFLAEIRLADILRRVPLLTELGFVRMHYDVDADALECVPNLTHLDVRGTQYVCTLEELQYLSRLELDHHSQSLHSESSLDCLPRLEVLVYWEQWDEYVPTWLRSYADRRTVLLDTACEI